MYRHFYRAARVEPVAAVAIAVAKRLSNCIIRCRTKGVKLENERLNVEKPENRRLAGFSQVLWVDF